ncbi:hypothetical protein AGMMS49546_36380 [Spirochaetia bacterium]|nr:hypothetical protein AGMMS49546_36380 [Spirochaetia bacterium]
MLPYRQIHLDFHTSPLIPDVGVDFNAEEFAQTLADARVQLINIFGKCHHGYAYYPSKVGPMHPSLKFDLLGSMIEALHKKGIRCPVYTTVVWDEYAAAAHPEWIQIDEEGRQVGRTPFANTPTGWKWLCLNNEYMDYLVAQVDEILEYNPDGLWFDINQYHVSGCCCVHCMKSMKDKGYDASNVEHRVKHSTEVLRASMDRLSSHVRAKKPDAAIIFNGRQRIDDRPWYSLRRETQFATQLDIESLPSGPWGYNHFPIFSRYNRLLGKEYLGMNGRFHKSWADFGGLKNQAALEFECFSMLSMGAKVNVGDQLHPRGKLDPETYKLIGNVFRQIEEKEPWCHDSKVQSEIGLMCVNDGPMERAQRPRIKYLEGAAQTLLELKAQFDIIDWEEPLENYRLVIFPDIVRFDPERAQKVSAYLAKGGAVILTGRSGFEPESDKFTLDLGFSSEGDSPYTATYMRLGDKLGKGLFKVDYVSYDRGLRVVAGNSCEVLAQVVEPYFERSWEHFMSHQQTPPDKVSKYAAAVRKGNAVYFADPIFHSYKTHGNQVYKQLIGNTISLLLGRQLVESDLPTTARLTVCDQGERRVVHILHYPVERRSEIDIIEDVIPLYNKKVEVKCDFAPSKVYLAPSLKPAEFSYADGVVKATVSEIIGHQMLVLER